MNKQEIKEIKDDIGKYKALEALKDSEGGEILIDTLNKDLVDAVIWLCANYQKAQPTEIVGKCAHISGIIAVLRTLKNAEDNAELAEEALKQISP